CDLSAGLHQPHGRRGAGHAAAGRRRARGPDRHPLRHPAARRAAAFPVGDDGAGRRRQAGLRPDHTPAPSVRDHDGPGMTRRLLLALALSGLLATVGGPARSDGIVADLSSHLIAISSSFTGTSVVLFGAIDGGGDIVAVVRGPEHELTVWRKGKVAGIWVNAEAVTFTGVPSFYAVAASRPIEEAVAPGPATLYRIGAANLKLDAKPGTDPERARRFAAALIAEQQQAGLFGADIGKISFLGERLFR